MRHPALVPLLVSLAAVSGCGGASPAAKGPGSDARTGDCKVLLDKRTAMEVEGDKLVQSDDEKDPKVVAANTRAAADLLLKFADSVDASSFHDEEVKKLAADYADFARAFAKSTQKLATLVEHTAEVGAAAGRASESVKAATQAFVTRCKASQNPACLKSGQVISGMPDAKSPTFVAETRRIADRLAEVSVSEDDELRSDLGNLVDAFRELANAFVALQRLKESASEGDALSKHGDGLDDRAKQLCGWSGPPKKKKDAD